MGIGSEGISGTSIFRDDVWTIFDDADTTKKLQFQVSGLTTGTTRTLTIPDADGTIALTTGSAVALVTVADEATDTTCFPLFVTAATGDLGPKTNANLAFNSSTGAFTFAGTLTAGAITTTGVFTQTLGGSRTGTGGDESLILTNSASAGDDVSINMTAGTSGFSVLNFGRPDDAVRGFIKFTNSTDIMTFAAGDGYVGLTLAGGSGAQTATFAGDIIQAVDKRVLVGHSSSLNVSNGLAANVQINGDTSIGTTSLTLTHWQNHAYGPVIAGGLNRAATIDGADVIVQDNDIVFQIQGFASDGVDNDERIANIQFIVDDDSPAGNAIAGSLVFQTAERTAGTMGDALTLAHDKTATFAGTLAAGAGSGFGIAPTDGTLHVHTATAGTWAPSANYDDLVVENSGAGGMSIATPDASESIIAMSSPSTNGSLGLGLIWKYSTGLGKISTGKVEADLQLRADNQVLNLTLSGASGSETATFAGEIILANAAGLIHGDNTANVVTIAGGNGNSDGGNIWLYGAGHAAANDVQIRSGINNILLYDDSASTITIGHNTDPTTFAGTVTAGAATFSGTSGLLNTSGTSGTQATFEASDAANADVRLNLYRNSASPAADDSIFQLSWLGKDSGGNVIGYAKIDAFIESPTDGTEQGRLVFSTAGPASGTMTDALTLDSSQNATFAGEILYDTTKRVDNAAALSIDMADAPDHFGTSFADIDATNMAFTLPTAGTYLILADMRMIHDGDAAAWSAVQLYNQSDTAAISNTIRMALEITETTQGLVNATIHCHWIVTFDSADEVRLQGKASVANTVGTFQDANGYSAFSYVRLY